MQPLDDIFSSPEKENDDDDSEDESDEEPMDIDEGKSDPGKLRVLSAMRQSTPLTRHSHCASTISIYERRPSPALQIATKD